MNTFDHEVFYFLLAGFLANTSVLSQGSWKVTVNEKTVLTATREDEAKNIVPIKASDLETEKDLIVCYNQKKNKAGWERSISLYNENDQLLTQQKGARLKLSNTELGSFFKQSKKIKIYTLALPLDPKRKASIRVRRVHLCTLILD